MKKIAEARSPSRMRAVAVLACATIASGLATAPASAQFIGGGWFSSFGPPPMIEPEGVVPLRVVARVLHSRGFRLTDLPARRGGRLYALAVDDYGRLSSVVLDAYNGTLLRAGPVAAGRLPGDVAAPIAKQKPRVKTAARPPVAPLPGAAPASPAPTPSQSLQTPAPLVTPVPPPAAAIAPPAVVTPPVVAPVTPVVAPPASAAIPTRPAPDAQPADVGPRVVPVKPAGEAKAPPPPADYDTEAGPRTGSITPDDANRMAPEMHKDE